MGYGTASSEFAHGDGTMNRRLFGFASFVLFALMVLPAQGAFYGIESLGSGATAQEFFGATNGWEFDVNSPITIDALGVFDDGGDGLANPHQVGIWPVPSAPADPAAYSVTVPAGTGQAFENNGWRYELLTTPANLPAGTYRIGATYLEGDDDAFLQGVSTAPGTDPEVTYVGGYYETDFSGATLTFPTTASGDDASFFGPNFRFGVEGPGVFVPEPSSFALIGLALLGMAGVLVRRRRAAA